MTKHDFIFSDQRPDRIARHVAFWTTWLLFYLLFFHYPIHTFRGWNINEASGTLQKIGPLKLVLKTLIFNAFLAVVVPHALFIYCLLYWLLPRFFYQKKNLFVVAGITIGFLLVSVFVFASFRVMVFIGNMVFGNSVPITSYFLTGSIYVVSREMITSFPIVLGFALLITLMKRWWLKQEETAQLIQEKTKVELQLLKAQVHPHFLFNTLNNIYFFTLKGSPKAPEMINKLSGLLKYILNECNQPFVPLKKEVAMIRDYMALEKIRYGEQMEMSIDIQFDDSEKLVTPLLLIPFVENSFKHGTSKMLAHPWVKLRMSIEDNMLHFFIINSRPQEADPQWKKGNIGLNNVKKRLQLLHPGAHDLNIVSNPDSFAVYLKVQLENATASSSLNEKFKTITVYAMA